VLTGYYQWGAGLAVTGRIRDIGCNVLHSSLKQEAVSAAVTSKFPSLAFSSMRPLLEIQYKNYIKHYIIIICINNNNNNNNNAVINNIYGRLQECILLFKILKDKRKDFFEMYRQFGMAPSKLFTSLT
jgi:hypothetical protein